MGLSDNPYIGLSASDIAAKRALYLQAEDDILKTGQSYAFPGLSLTQASLSEIRASLSLLTVAYNFVTGATPQVAQVRINTRTQFTGQVPLDDSW